MSLTIEPTQTTARQQIWQWLDTHQCQMVRMYSPKCTIELTKSNFPGGKKEFVASALNELRRGLAISLLSQAEWQTMENSTKSTS